MLEDETFLEWIDQRVTSQRFYAAITLIGGKVSSGLPVDAPQALVDAITEEAAYIDDKSTSSSSETEKLIEPAECFYAAHFTDDDLIVGGQQHLETVRSMLAHAKSFVLLHSCFVHPDAVRTILPEMEAAARKGIVIELLWGQRNDEVQEWSRNAFLRVKEIFASLPGALRSKIRFSERETGSHAKVLIGDAGPDGKYEAYVGSCNWLSSRYAALEVSIRVREPKVIAIIAAHLATLRMPASGRWTPDVYRLVEIRNNLIRQVSDLPMNGSAAVLTDREHLRAIRLARDDAMRRILAACDLYGPAGETSVFVPMRTAAKDGTEITLFYNNLASSIESSEAQAAIAMLAKKNIQLKKCNTLHGKFLLWDDDTVLVSSFNWLATTPSPWKPSAAEIGILIKSPGIAKSLLGKLAKVSGDFADLSERAA